MRLRTVYAGLAGTMIAFAGALTGCGGSPEGDLPVNDQPLSQEESDRIAKQVELGMKGGYQGAPGAPAPPGAKADAPAAAPEAK